MSKRYVDLGWGNRCSLGAYVRGWKAALASDPTRRVSTVPGRFDGGTVADVLTALRGGMHDRINAHDPSYGVGRKWASQWQADARRTARAVNTPRLVVDWVPLEFRGRLARRLERTS